MDRDNFREYNTEKAVQWLEKEREMR